MPLNREQSTVVDQIKPLLELIPTIETLKKQIADNPTNFALLSNTAFVARKCSEILDSMRKELDKVETKVAETCFDQWPNIATHKYSGEYCTIKDNSDVYVKYPTKPEDAGYFEFMQQLGPELTRPHYPSIGNALIEAIGRGSPIPWGLKAEDMKGVNYKLYIRKRKDL